MKRSMLLAALTTVGSLTLTGCMSATDTENEGSGTGADQNTSGAAKPSASVSAKPIKFGDTVKISADDGGVFRVTVTAPKKAKAGPLGPPSGNKKLLAVKVTIVALKGKVTFNPLYFKAKSSQGDSFESALGSTESQLDSGTITAPDKERGLVAFEVPAGQKIASVSITDPLLSTQATWRR